MSKQPTRDRIDPEKLHIDTAPKRRPDWIRVKAPAGSNYEKIERMLRGRHLHTVCEEAGCPNMGECFNSGTATFLILGDVCTRSCRFCDIKHGMPDELDWDEPERVAQSVRQLNLRHAVITSVNRDEREDGGAPIYAAVIRRIREVQPGCKVEVLIPDFKGSIDALKIVMDEKPDVLNHNIETVSRLSKMIQPQARKEWSRATLVNAKILNPEGLTKSGIMVGMGETIEEVKEAMRDLREWDVDLLTIGQYLQPSRRHWPIDRYYTPVEFVELRRYGESIGFKHVVSAPLVRSSYHAAEMTDQV
ncbi:MAG: lipoyl synthase [Anaerolineaceae bacterium]|nr:lipoyl synthase [Anaerolineaceae bacterium]